MRAAIRVAPGRPHARGQVSPWCDEIQSARTSRTSYDSTHDGLFGISTSNSFRVISVPDGLSKLTKPSVEQRIFPNGNCPFDARRS